MSPECLTCGHVATSHGANGMCWPRGQEYRCACDALVLNVCPLTRADHARGRIRCSCVPGQLTLDDA